jgi:hypothetical protein
MVRVSDDSAQATNEVPPPATPNLVAVKDATLPVGVSQVDFDAALAVGRAKGSLTPDELIEALHYVELTPEVLVVLLERINAEGVALVDDDIDALAGESRTASGRRPPSLRAVRKIPSTPI